MKNFSPIFTLVAGVALFLLQSSAASAAEEFVSAEFFSRPGELRAVFQLTGNGVRVNEARPRPDKLVVEVSGLCRSPEAGGSCPEGPASSLQKLYRFEKGMPPHQLNVVDLGTGTVQLLWQLENPLASHRVALTGDKLEIILGAPGASDVRRPMPPQEAKPPEPEPSYDLDRLTRPPARVASQLPTRNTPEPAARPRSLLTAETKLTPPDPRFLDIDREYRLGVGDRIQVVVHADERLNRDTLEIAPTGYADLPLIGSLPVAGHTVIEVEAELERLLGESYLKDPDVTILVEEYNSQWVNVMGAVAEGGKVPLKGSTTLMDALTEVGGTAEEASGQVIIHRKGETTPTRVRLDDLFSGVPDANILLAHGDTINVERKRPFYVSGEVKNPGKYDIEPGMTLLDAIAMAGGLTEYAKEKGVIVIRTEGSQRREIHANLKAIEKGKEENMAIEPGDHIKVSGSLF